MLPTTLPKAFYHRDGERFVPTDLCIGPWHENLQHGGPPAALLAASAQSYGEDADEFLVTRVTVELMRPVPLTPLTRVLSPIRIGRQAQWLQASLFAADEELVRASVVRIRCTAFELPPDITKPEAPPPPPDLFPPFDFPLTVTDVGYHRAIDLHIDGEWGRGPTTAWLRPRVPLVAEEETTALERLMIVADAANGIAPCLPVKEFAFINPDLTVHVHRLVEGEWVALRARSIPEGSGVGLVQSAIFDSRGQIGHCLQSLVIRPR